MRAFVLLVVLVVTAVAVACGDDDEPAGPLPPDGYAASCAGREHPWAELLRTKTTFACIDAPGDGDTVPATTAMDVRGWAAAPAGRPIAVQAQVNDTAGRRTLATTPVSLSSSVAGLVTGPFRITVTPPDTPPGERIRVHLVFATADDGQGIGDAEITVVAGP